jgi:outer membrane protein assembly factor BamB
MHIGRPGSCVVAGVCLLVLAVTQLAVPLAVAQFEPRPGDLSDAVSLELADSAALGHLKRLSEYLTGPDKKWDDAVRTLRSVMDGHGDGLVRLDDASGKAPGLTNGRYVSIRHFCQLRLSAMPPEALAIYRKQVDDTARGLFEKAAKARDRRGLLEVVENFFCSSVGDDALLRLGDLALEEGDSSAARDYWSRITPLEAPGNFDAVRKDFFQRVRNDPGLPADDAALLDQWYEIERSPVSKENVKYRLRTDRALSADVERRLARLWTWHGRVNELKYPDMELESAGAADVDARFVLASIMEGSLEQAQVELNRFAHLHADAQGTLGGKRVHWSTALTALLRDSLAWPRPPRSTDWPTFAGAPDRNAAFPGEIDIQGPSWSIELNKVVVPDVKLPLYQGGFTWRRVAEGPKEPLSYHPVVVGGKVLFADEDRVFAFNLRDGTPAWPTVKYPKEGIIFPVGEVPAAAVSRQPYVGVPRFTLTAHGDKLFVRLGSPITSSVESYVTQKPTSSLICLDLAYQGRPVWEAKAPDEWAFEGAPVTDGARVYAAQRRRGSTARTRVVCFDAETGRALWQRFVCGAETPARGQVDECTHNLLTLHQDTLYYSTNLGAVAALSAQDGSIRWITLYARAKSVAGEASTLFPAYMHRDLTPCLYHNGLLFVAPSDCDAVLALVASTGQMLGAALEETARCRPNGPTAVHLLGVVGDYLIASGDKVWWLNVKRLRDKGEFYREAIPGEEDGGGFRLEQAYGRGVIVGEQVYVPTREAIPVFHGRSPGKLARQPIQLAPRKAGGGNLVVTDTHLLIVGTHAMFGFELSRPLSRNQPPESDGLRGDEGQHKSDPASTAPAKTQQP